MEKRENNSNTKKSTLGDLGVLKFFLLLIVSFALIQCTNIKEESNTVKNVIILIPDGTASPLLTLTRWYNDNNPLAVDSLICGIVKTYNADGTFPDSAPAGSSYGTGVKTIPPYIGIDSDAQPRVSVLELARLKGLATGVVATSEFPHATPAAFVCHFNNRESGKYRNLAKQFIYNSPNIVFAGGEAYLDKNDYNGLLKPNEIELITSVSDFESKNELPESGNIWALFPDWKGSTEHLSYECDRDSKKAPSLSEMTAKAIKLLSQNKNGFFLMLEGSQIDWAAHNNDPFAAVTDFIEFDKAVAVALEFAKKDNNTVVIVCPDHGTGGISIGNERSTGYTSMVIYDTIIKPLKEINYSGRKIAEMMIKDSAYESENLLKEYLKKYNINNPSKELLNSLKEEIKKENSGNIQRLLGKTFSLQNYIGWTTGGHTAEDVFLAIYAPKNVKKLSGTVENYEIGRYIANILNLGDLDKSTEELFKKHTAFFSKDEIISPPNSDSLVVMKNGKKLTFESNTNVLKINEEKEVRLPSIIVCIDEVYYLPELIRDYYK